MSKLLLLSFMFVADLFFNYCCAQTKILHHEIDGFIWYEVCEENKYGAEDTLGNILVPKKYYSIGYHTYDKWKNGIVWGGKFWVVPFVNEGENVYNRDGNHIITASQKYFDISKETQNPFGTYYKCRRRGDIKRTDILDVYGKTVCTINLYFHTSLKMYNNIFYFLVYNYENSKTFYGIVDGNGKEIVPLNYPNKIEINADGLFYTLMSNGETKTVGSVYDIKTKNPLANNPFEDITCKSNYLFREERDINNKILFYEVIDKSFRGIMDEKKKWIIPLNREYLSIQYDTNKKEFIFFKKGYKGICNNLGKEISIVKLPPTIDDIKVNGGYASAVEMKNGSTKYYKVSKDGRYGLTNGEGKEIVPCEMEALESAGTGYLKYKLNGFWGVMNYTGKIIIDTDRGYTSIGDFKTFNKRFAYTMTGYKGECDATGRQISKIKVETPPQQTVAKQESTPKKEEKKVEEIIIKHDPVPMQVWKQCTICYGSGKCQTCGGTGIFTGWSGNKTICEYGCGGSGKCSFCAGHGGHYEVEYK